MPSRPTRPAGRTPPAPCAGPPGCASPPTPTTSSRSSGPRTARKVDGELVVGRRRRWPTWPPSTAPRPTCSTRTTSGPAPRAFRDAFAGFDVFYAGKAFLCTAVARWVAEEGLRLDVCSRRRAHRRPARPASRPGPDRLPRQQQDRPPSSRARSTVGVGRIVVDSFDEIGAPRRPSPRDLGVAQRVMVRVTAGVEAHTHEYIATAHEDQKFGLSITSGDALEAVRRVLAAPGLELLGLHSHIGSQIFDASGFEVAARRVLALHAQVATELGVAPARDGPRRRLRHRLHDPGRPRRRPSALAADDAARSSSTSAGRWASPCPRLSIEPGRAIAGPGDVHRSTPSARSSRSPSTAGRCAPTSRSTAG